MDGIDALPLRELAEALRTGALRSEQVVAHYQARIAAVNPSLRALVHPATDAMAQARAADLKRASGAACGPLHGVPFTVKDWIEVAGLPCDAGHAERRDFVPKRHATVIARLGAAGGIVLGKTKTGGSADAVHPACHNPIDLARTPGASSSGEAALVAARATPFGVGSDSGGSIRWPAHCCGVVGLKPSHGRVPNTGHFPPISALHDPRTVIGPLAQRVDDVALVYGLLQGADGVDSAALPLPHSVPDARLDPATRAGKLRIAWFAGWANEHRGWGATRSEVARTVGTDETGLRALHAAVAAARDAGHALIEMTPPLIEEARAITEAYWARRQSISLRTWQPVGPSTLTADEIETSLFAWERLRRSFVDFMTRFDLILCPAAPRLAPLLGETVVDDYAFTLPFSLTGQPVVCLPAARSADGLPANVQVVAPMLMEPRALAVAGEIEARLGLGPATLAL